MLLENLPVELLLLVASHLTTPEYNAFRLTSKALKTATYDSWAQEFFSTRQFSLQLHSLEVLVAISTHDDLRRRLKRLIIGTDHINHYSHVTRGGADTSIEAKRKWPKYNEFLQKQSYAWTTNLDGRTLADALRALPNVHTLEVRNFDSTFQGGRTRDGVPWRSYGWSTFEEAGEYRYEQNMEIGLGSNYSASQVFQKVLAAAVECRRLRQITAHFHSSRFRFGRADVLTGSAFCIPSMVLPSYRTAFRHLETLMINISNDGDGDSLKDLVPFARLVPDLKHLRINWLHNDAYPFLADGLMPLAQELKNLTKLELGTMRLKADELLLIKTFQSLRELSLFQISLRPGNWLSLLPALVKAMPALRTLSVIQPRERFEVFQPFETTWCARVAFKRTPNAIPADMDDKCLTNSITITDKRDSDLMTAVEKSLELFVVDDADFRKARGLLSEPRSRPEQFDPSESESDEGEDEGDVEDYDIDIMADFDSDEDEEPEHT